MRVDELEVFIRIQKVILPVRLLSSLEGIIYALKDLYRYFHLSIILPIVLFRKELYCALYFVF